MNNNNSKKPDYRVINIPYEFKNSVPETTVFDKTAANENRADGSETIEKSEQTNHTQKAQKNDRIPRKNGGAIYNMMKKSGAKKQQRAAHAKQKETVQRTDGQTDDEKNGGVKTDAAKNSAVKSNDVKSAVKAGRAQNAELQKGKGTGKSSEKTADGVMTSKKKDSAGAASFFGRKKKSANEEKNGKAFPKTAVTVNGKKMKVIMGGKLKKIGRFKRLIATAAVLLAVFIAANLAIPVGLIDATGEFFAGFSATGEGFPLEISSAVGKNISTVGSDIAVLCQSTLMLYKANGKQIYNRPHGYSNPAMSTSGYRTLVYDRGGKGYKIEKRGGTFIDSTAQNDIVTASIADNGAFALATRSGDYVCDVTAFDKKGRQKMQWHSSDRQVVALALSSDGRYMGVGTLSGQNGKMVSSILIFRTNDGTVICDNSFENHTVVSIDFKGDTLVGVFESMLTSISTRGVRTDFDLKSAKVSCFAQSSSAVAVTVEKYNDSANNQLMLFDKKLTRIYTADIGAQAISLSLAGNKAVVLSNEKVISFDGKGGQQKFLDAGADARQIASSGAGTAVLGTSRVEWRKV